MEHSERGPLAWMRDVRRSHDGALVQGVCAGLGKYSPLPTWAWRVTFGLLLLWKPAVGLPLYVALALFLPQPVEPTEVGPYWRALGRAVGRTRAGNWLTSRSSGPALTRRTAERQGR